MLGGGVRLLFSILVLSLHSTAVPARCGQHQAWGQLPANVFIPGARPGHTTQRPARPTPVISVPPNSPCVTKVRSPPLPPDRGGEGRASFVSFTPSPIPALRGRVRTGYQGGAQPGLRAPHQAGACPYSLQWANTGRTCPMAPLGPASGPLPTPATPPWAWGRGHSSPPNPRCRRHPCRRLLPGCSRSRRRRRRPLLGEARRAGPRQGRHCSAGLGAGPKDRRGGA